MPTIRRMLFIVCAALALWSSGAAAQTPRVVPQDAASLLTSGAPSGPQGDTLASIAELPDWSSNTWLPMGTGGPFGRCVFPPGVPENPFTCFQAEWTDAWQPKFDSLKQMAEAGGDVSYRAQNCLPAGYAGALVAGAGGGLTDILLTPGRVTFIPENWQGRRVYTDGRKHADDGDETFSGDNIGHWEDGMLVIDTVGLLPEVPLVTSVPAGRGLHIVQRIWPIDANTIEWRTVQEAPLALKTPRVFGGRLTRNTKWVIRENYCQENNRDILPDGTQTFDLTPPPLDP